MKRLLLVSTSTTYGTGYLDHAEEQVCDLFSGVDRVLFVPFALADHDAYAAKVCDRFAAWGKSLDSLHSAADARKAVDEAEGIFIGGGNTFRLLKALYDRELLPAIRDRVEAGVPYMGTSAGSNVACVSIRTTNDMPIVMPPSFDALGLVPFNINPHYIAPDPDSKHMGETRDTRIKEFHEENHLPVVGLKEGAMLAVEGATVKLLGEVGGRLFRRDQAPEEISPGADLTALLN